MTPFTPFTWIHLPACMVFSAPCLYQVSWRTWSPLEYLETLPNKLFQQDSCGAGGTPIAHGCNSSQCFSPFEHARSGRADDRELAVGRRDDRRPGLIRLQARPWCDPAPAYPSMLTWPTCMAPANKTHHQWAASGCYTCHDRRHACRLVQRLEPAKPDCMRASTDSMI